ncbi:MAG: hypothetical protein R8M45_04550 [Ghiorsea sp.]
MRRKGVNIINYKDGYNDGFVAGYEKAVRDNIASILENLPDKEDCPYSTVDGKLGYMAGVGDCIAIIDP